MKKCFNCGIEIVVNVKFCIYCGYDLIKVILVLVMVNVILVIVI